ncbi:MULTISPECIES: ExbD/TolR family protein [Pandoraea]|uniref:Biopolymer transporter ExbD n=2 Tax=Pandoraea TaxID=93217 RepID=A0A5E4ZB44_9BURK|nr:MULTISPECIES: biopolymer transporter ExbD [Pandoraea]ALS59350.1 biopolymer transporter ExbD [Pandoraea norimbergensis]VVE57126.1 biopolymer transporter ExbD [Pandoraea iniqua]VVE58591.1 biopolymer transporter ExbD [Pandoraea iniqua]
MIHFEDPPKRHARIEIIPMIDVMMFLLVFFVLLSINVIPSRGLSTTLPQSSSAAQVNPEKPVVVTITRDGALQVDGADTTLEALGARVKEKAGDVEKAQVTLKTDEGTLMQRVIDVMDALKAASVSKISIATRAKS